MRALARVAGIGSIEASVALSAGSVDDPAACAVSRGRRPESQRQKAEKPRNTLAGPGATKGAAEDGSVAARGTQRSHSS
jgi:hypothetical protein